MNSKTNPASGSGKSHLPRNFWLIVCMATAALLPAQFAPAAAGDLQLQELVDEALQNSPEILAAQSRALAAKHRVPQASSLPDPMLMTGYQNDGFTGYTYGNSSDSQWMFSASQTVPFPGKLSLKGEMAAREAEGLSASHQYGALQSGRAESRTFITTWRSPTRRSTSSGTSPPFFRGPRTPPWPVMPPAWASSRRS